MSDCYLEQGDQRQPVTAAQPVSIGSGEANTLRLSVAGVQEEHVVVRLDGERVVLQSRTPGEHDARVNGVAVHASSIKSGDKLEFGDIEATFETSGEESKLVVGDTPHDLIRGVNAIGRDPDGSVQLSDDSVSRKHAALMVLPSGQTLIRDLGSANGTVVNGRRLGEIDLSDGDEVRIGDAVLHLRRKDAAVQAKGDAPAPSQQSSGSAAGAAMAATVVGSRLNTPEAGEEAPAAAKLELEFGGKKFELREGTFQIGRATDCTIVIDDDALVSRHHAEVEVSGSLVMLRDLGSSNGTRLNGETIPRAQPLNDGDRIGIGGKEITFTADIPVTPFGQTMVAKELPGAAGKTVMAPGDSGAPPTDRASALRVLELDANAGESQIQQRYRELFSEFQVRLTNAPTAELKATYQGRIDALRAALGILVPGGGAAAAQSDLPALQPVEDGDGEESAVTEQPAATGTAGHVGAGGDAEPQATAVGSADKSARVSKLPRSTIVVGSVAAVLAVGVTIGAIGALRASRSAAGLEADLVAKSEELQGLEVAIPETQQALEQLAQGKGQLVEQNLELKICNHSSAPLRWVWLNVAWFDPESGGFKDFDTAYDTQWEYLYYESIEPGSAFSGGRWVVGEERVWDGSAVFFAARFEYRGQEILRAGAMPAFGGDCYPLNLDR